MRFRVAFSTLGCKTNHYDTAALTGRLDPETFEIVPEGEAADACVINTCTVTSASDRQSRQSAFRARRRNPEALVILTGCYALSGAEALKEAKGIDRIVPKGSSPSVEAILAEAARRKGLDPQAADHGPRFESQARPYLKVQDGCEAACSYCVVPSVRGPSVSDPAADVLARLARLQAQGVREVILTGIHLGRWGNDLPGKPGLEALLAEIARSGLMPRVRLSSIEPMELNGAVLDVLSRSPVFCPHLHVPLQSGCDRTLERMRRPYRARHFRERIELAVQAIPGLALGLDVMAGFPGEEEADFEETVRFVESLPFQYLHVFPFSARPGTAAAGMSGQVPPEVKRRRARRLLELSGTRRRARAEAALGQTLTLLVESVRDRPTGLWPGLSPDYQEVLIDSAAMLNNKIVSARAVRMYNHTHRLMGELVETPYR